LTAGVAIADGVRAPNPNQFDWIREYLQEFSVVTDGGASGPRDIISTRLDPHPDAGCAVLGYQRASYSGPDANSLQTQQLIQYTVRLSDITPESVRVQAWDGFNADQAFWLVRAVIAEEADYVSYTNVLERRIEDGSVEVTSSRGRVREIVLGYFTDETIAARLAENFRDMLTNLA
jgi:hypothetical protein